jgi:hypothetical protein
MFLNSTYDKPIVNDIKITDDMQTVISKLGEESRKYINSKDSIILEDDRIYLLLDMKNHIGYVYFKRDAQISKFMEYVDKYLKDRDLKSFVNSMTETYKEYDRFEYNSRKVHLVYSTLGIEIYATNTDKMNNGINIYENSKYYEILKNKYLGLDINKNNNYEVIKPEIELGVIFKSEDLVEKQMKYRIEREKVIGEAYVTDIENKFNVAVLGDNTDARDSDGQVFNRCVVCFDDPKIERYNLNAAGTADSIYVTNNYIYYTLNNSGIFRLEPYSRKLEKIISFKGSGIIESIENGIMKYKLNGEENYLRNVY